MISLLIALIMPPDLVAKSMAECRTKGGEPVVQHQLYKHGRYSSPVDIEGVDSVHCYMQNGNVRIYKAEPPVRLPQPTKRGQTLTDRLEKK